MNNDKSYLGPLIFAFEMSREKCLSLSNRYIYNLHRLFHHAGDSVANNNGDVIQTFIHYHSCVLFLLLSLFFFHFCLFLFLSLFQPFLANSAVFVLLPNIKCLFSTFYSLFFLLNIKNHKVKMPANLTNILQMIKENKFKSQTCMC